LFFIFTVPAVRTQLYSTTFPDRLIDRKQFLFEGFEDMEQALSAWNWIIESHFENGSSIEYLYEYPDSVWSHVAGYQLNSLKDTEFDEAILNFENHFIVTGEDSFSGNKCFLAILNDDVNNFHCYRTNPAEGDVVGLSFSMKFEDSGETISGSDYSWKEIASGFVTGPDDFRIRIMFVARGNDRMAWIWSEKDEKPSTVLFDLEYDRWYRLEMLVDTVDHKAALLVDSYFGANGPFASSNLTSRGGFPNELKLGFDKGVDFSDFRVYIDDFKIFVSSADTINAINNFDVIDQSGDSKKSETELDSLERKTAKPTQSTKIMQGPFVNVEVAILSVFVLVVMCLTIFGLLRKRKNK
jgi:hypothetical protein